MSAVIICDVRGKKLQVGGAIRGIKITKINGDARAGHFRGRVAGWKLETTKRHEVI